MKKDCLLPIFLAIGLTIWMLCGCATQTPVRHQPIVAKSAMAPAERQERGTVTENSTDGASSELSSEEEALLDDDWEETDAAQNNEVNQVADPIEPFNRVMFQFNDTLYTWLLRPVALGYRKVTPQLMRTGFQNFFTNLGTPIRMVNCLLQGKGQAAGAEFGKFLFNSTYGILGFGDLFTNYPEMNPDPEDLGQSLATYGIGDGFYLVLPFFGPRTARDTLAMAGDYWMDPVNYLKPWQTSLAVKSFDKINYLTFRIEDLDSIEKAAFDPYEAFRNFYIQSRRNSISR